MKRLRWLELPLIIAILVASLFIFIGFMDDKYSIDSENQLNKDVMEILSIWPEDSDNGKLIVKLTEQYIEEVNPEFKYEYKLVSVDKLDETIATLLSSDDLPDVFVYDSGEPLKQLIKRDVLLDIGAALNEKEAYQYLDERATELLKALSDTQTLYDLPLGLNVEGFWYNKNIFNQWDMKPPTTWDEFFEVCEAFLEVGIQPLSAGGADKWPLTRYINAYAYRSMGSSIMDRAAEGQIAYTAEGLIKAAQILAEMVQKGYFGNNVMTVDQDSAGDMLLKGEAAMFYNGSWFTEKLVSDSNPSGEDGIGFFPIPIIDESISSLSEFPMNCGNILAMSKAKYNEQTADWLYYFVSHIGDLAMDEFGAVKGYQYHFEGELSNYSELVASTIESATSSTKWFEASMKSDMRRVAQDSVQALIAGDISGEEYMELIEQEFLKNQE
ncbi:MAG: extracellular solute-binding protein [Vallitaleaceae bacterium]|nr:extracellular solute-binding protein [Vallitaleaceae bacterium]